MTPFKKCCKCAKTKERCEFYASGGPCKVCSRAAYKDTKTNSKAVTNRLRQRQSSQKLGIIYFAQQRNDDGFIKIGYTRKLEQRIRHSRFTDNPYPIATVATTAGFQWQEMLLHKLLSDSLIHGEWFYPTPEVLEVIKVAQEGTLTPLLVDT